MCFGTKPDYLRVRSELPPHDHSFPRRENGEGQEGVSPPLQKKGMCIRQGSCPLDWPANLDHTSHSPGPTPLQRSAEAQEQSTLSIPLLRSGDRTGRDARKDLHFWISQMHLWNGRPITTPTAEVTIMSDASTSGWGASCGTSQTEGPWTLSECQMHINMLELRAAYLALQTYATCLRNQHILLLIDNQTAIAYLNHKGGTWSKQLSDLALEGWDWCLRKNLTIHAEHIPGRLNTTADRESRRKVDSSDWRLNPEIFLYSHAEIGTVQYRPVCGKAQHPARKILQLPTQSSGRSYGCIGSEMGSSDSLCLPPLHFGWQGLAENKTGGSASGSGDCTTVAVATMVSSYVGHADGLPNSSTPDSYLHNQSERRITPLDEAGPSSVSRLESLRQRIGKGISKETFELMSAAWRKGTEKRYSSAWKCWSSWCSQRGCNPLSPSIGQILQFLTEEFQKGKQYSTINLYRSALSATLPTMDGYPVGQHPLVCRLLQGVFNKRPPAPRYQNVWNVSIGVAHICKLPTDLPLKDLTKKLAMLLALTNASRSSDLHALDLRFRTFTAGVLFRIPGLTKTRRSGPPKEAMFAAFEENPSLCPVNTLKQYEKLTASLRGAGSASHQLFVSLRKPVSSATIAHWLKTLLSDAGVDTEIFKAHSTRVAASSTAKCAGASTADILKMAGWSRSSTFERFYHKPVVGSNRVLADGVQGESLNDTMSYMQPCHDMEL